MAVFTISIESNFRDLWRYNTIVMANVMRDSEQVEILKHLREVAPIGAELSAPPEDYDDNRKIKLQSVDADALTLYIYIIPHTLPVEQEVSAAKPFELDVKVKHGGRIIYTHRYMINQWSGENISIAVSAPQEQQTN